MSEKFTKVVVERNDENENYTIRGLPENAVFRKPDNYTEITASYLSVNGVGFACSSAEFSQYDTTITVEQKTDGGSANIVFN